VTLISTVEDQTLPGSIKKIMVCSARDMLEAVKKYFSLMNIIIMAAAVADHRPKSFSDKKIKKELIRSVELVKNPDILEYMGKNKSGQFILGFALENENGIENAYKKLLKKKCDLIAYNNPCVEGSGFGEETTIVSLIDIKKNIIEYPKLSKTVLARKVLFKIVSCLTTDKSITGKN
ncbi:MAG: phosphopantothenoylcysteine decarboxylase, partial [bacterium]